MSTLSIDEIRSIGRRTTAQHPQKQAVQDARRKSVSGLLSPLETMFSGDKKGCVKIAAVDVKNGKNYSRTLHSGSNDTPSVNADFEFTHTTPDFSEANADQVFSPNTAEITDATPVADKPQKKKFFFQKSDQTSSFKDRVFNVFKSREAPPVKVETGMEFVHDIVQTQDIGAKELALVAAKPIKIAKAVIYGTTALGVILGYALMPAVFPAASLIAACGLGFVCWNLTKPLRLAIEPEYKGIQLTKKKASRLYSQIDALCRRFDLPKPKEYILSPGSDIGYTQTPMGQRRQLSIGITLFDSLENQAFLALVARELIAHNNAGSTLGGQVLYAYQTTVRLRDAAETMFLPFQKILPKLFQKYIHILIRDGKDVLHSAVLRNDMSASQISGTTFLAQGLAAQSVIEALIAGGHIEADEAFSYSNSNLTEDDLDAAFGSALTSKLPWDCEEPALVERLKRLDTNAPAPDIPPMHSAAAQFLDMPTSAIARDTAFRSGRKKNKSKREIMHSGNNANTPSLKSELPTQSVASRIIEPGSSKMHYTPDESGAMQATADTAAPVTATEQFSEHLNQISQDETRSDVLDSGAKDQDALSLSQPTAQISDPAFVPASQTLFDEDELDRADAIASENPKAGVEAYGTLSKNNPDWMAVRLRLGQAMLDASNPQGIEVLIKAAPYEPHAIGAIVETIEQFLREGGDSLREPDLLTKLGNMSSMARKAEEERIQVNFDILNPWTMSQSAMDTLCKLIASLSHANRAWAFSSPCSIHPSTPHHVIFVETKDISEEDGAEAAMRLADRIRIGGTVAVIMDNAPLPQDIANFLSRHKVIWKR
jgi:hypothetical protein